LCDLIFSCLFLPDAFLRTPSHPSLSFLPYATFAVRTPCTLIGNGSDLAFALVGRRGKKRKLPRIMRKAAMQGKAAREISDLKFERRGGLRYACA